MVEVMSARNHPERQMENLPFHEYEPDHSNLLADLRDLLANGKLSPAGIEKLKLLEMEERRRAAVFPSQREEWVAEGKRIIRWGQGQTPENRRAFNLFHHAAVAGHAEAQALVYECHVRESGAPPDLAAFIFWRLKAAESGYAPAQYALGDNYYFARLLVEQDYAEAVKWWRRAAEHGHAEAQNALGHCCKYGHGVEIDHAQAVIWFRRAVAQGHVVAQYNLAHSLYMGLGVEKDYEEAVLWLGNAAESGDAKAQHGLALMYEHGHGVPINMEESAKWAKRAAQTDAAQTRNVPESTERIIGTVRRLDPKYVIEHADDRG